MNDFDLTSVMARISPYLEQELRRIADIVVQRKIAKESFANGEVIEVRDISEYGNVEDATSIKIPKVSHVGIFQAHSNLSYGTNTSTETVQELTIPIREISHDVRLGFRQLQGMAAIIETRDADGMLLESGDVSSLKLLTPNAVNPLIKAYRNYLETYGYNGDLSIGLQGLASVPSYSYNYPTAWSSLTGDLLLSAIIDTITAVNLTDATIDFTRILMPTAAYNTAMSKLLPGTSDTVLSALKGLGFTVEKVVGLDSAFGAATVLYLPALNDPELFFGKVGDMTIKFFSEGDSIIVRGYAQLAGVISLNSGNMIRATGF